jgi:hypothetical protein
MLKVLQVCMAIGLLVLGTSLAQAQTVEMSGSFGERNGRVVNIPQNPPLTICGAGGNLTSPPAAPGDSRCNGSRIKNALGTNPLTYAAPAFGVGVKGGHRVIPGGLLKGSTFTVPPQALSQNLGLQGGPVINNPVVYLDTTFQAVLPGTSRSNNPPANTRVMRPLGAAPISGQTGRPNAPTTGPNAGRITITMSPTGMDIGTITYNEGVNKFGGTMASLLDGEANLYIKTPAFDAYFPTAVTPVMGIQPVGNTTISLMERGGAGWNYPIPGVQGPGKVVGPANIVSFVPCGDSIPATPANCNEVTSAFAVTLDVGNFLPSANSTKFAFPFTTGTVTNYVKGFRNGQTITTTLTAMGYDTTTATAGVRNIGLVSGSYTQRQSGTGNELASQMIGLNLSFTPEPGAAVALFAGIGLLGLAAARRRR